MSFPLLFALLFLSLLFLRHELFVLLLELSLDVLERLLDLAADLVVRTQFEIRLIEEVTVLLSDELKHLALCKRRHEVAVEPMTIEDTEDLDLSV